MNRGKCIWFGEWGSGVTINFCWTGSNLFKEELAINGWRKNREESGEGCDRQSIYKVISFQKSISFYEL